MAKRLNIFISYKRGEGDDAAREIENYLTRKKNYSVFRDVDKIEGGEDWSQKIVRSIKKSDIFILVLTPLSLLSGEVQKEVQEAQRWNKRILPCKHENINIEKLKWDLGKLNIIEYSEKNISALLLSIDDSIDTYISEKRKHIVKKGFSIGLPIFAIGLFTYLLLGYFLNPDIQISYQSDNDMVIGMDYTQMFSNLSSPSSIAVDTSGNLYVADTGNNRIQKFSSDGNFTEWGQYGSGPGQFSSPSDIAVDNFGNVYVADTDNNRIQKFTSDGNFTNEWGGQGSGTSQSFTPSGIALDTSDNVYVADTGNNRIQKFTSGGKYLSSIGEFGHGKENFNLPVDIDIDSKDNIFVADKGNNRIQKIEGSSVKKWLEEFKFDSPSGVALDDADNLYVSDTNNHKIYRFDANGKNVTNCKCSFGGLGFLSNNLYFPSGIDVDDDSGDVYVVDEGNNQIKKFIVKETPTRESSLFPFNESK